MWDGTFFGNVPPKRVSVQPRSVHYSEIYFHYLVSGLLNWLVHVWTVQALLQCSWLRESFPTFLSVTVRVWWATGIFFNGASLMFFHALTDLCSAVLSPHSLFSCLFQSSSYPLLPPLCPFVSRLDCRPSLVMVQKPAWGVMVPCCLSPPQPVPCLPRPRPPSR